MKKPLENGEKDFSLMVRENLPEAVKQCAKGFHWEPVEDIPEWFKNYVTEEGKDFTFEVADYGNQPNADGIYYAPQPSGKGLCYMAGGCYCCTTPCWKKDKIQV